MRLASRARAVAALAVALVLAAAVVVHAWRALDSSADPIARLRGDPLDAGAAAAAAAAFERAGRSAAAERAWILAARLGRRDPEVQARLIRSAVEAGDWAQAALSADAILRGDGQGAMRPALFPFLDLMAADPAARPALVAQLAGRPDWRGDYVAGQGRNRRLDPATATALLEALARAGSPPGPYEYRPLIEAQVREGRPAEALDLWRRMTARSDRDLVLRDPDFALGSDGGPFTWREASGVGVQSALEPAPPGVPGKAMTVDYDGFSSPRLPAQLAVLAPGSWRLDWRERAQGAARLSWQARCDGADQPLARAPAAADPVWRARSLTFDVPAAACPAVWIELSPSPGERRTNAVLSSADLSLARPSPG